MYRAAFLSNGADPRAVDTMSLYEVYSTAGELNRMRSNRPEVADVSDDDFDAFQARMAALTTKH